MNKRILALALPSIVSNLTVPLLSLMDVAIVGHLGSEVYIGAIAVGGMLFSMLYWGFGFLRMGTGGLTAQAYGRGDHRDLRIQFVRAQGVAFFIAVLLIACSAPLRNLAFHFIEASPDVRHWATVYFNICVWGAPAVLGLYACTGWFVGMQNSRYPMQVAIMQNVVNIALSLFFVYALRLGVEGVAYGTLIAQWSGFLLAIKRQRQLAAGLHDGDRRRAAVAFLRDTFPPSAMLAYFRLNVNIFGRTLCLIAVTVFFTIAGSRQGDTTLAVNTLLMQLFTLFSYIMDGFAYAGEALAGRYYGAKDAVNMRNAVRLIFRWGWVLTAAFTVLYGCFGGTFLSLLTSEQGVLEAAEEYYIWVACIPLCGFAAFLWDGVFIGLTAAKQMLTAMIIASATFFIAHTMLSFTLGNHALWLSFLAYLSLRGIGQWAYYGRLTKKHGLTTI